MKPRSLTHGLVVMLIVVAPVTALAEDIGPVLLLHGIWGGPDSWADLGGRLQDLGWRQGCLMEFPGGSAVPEMVPPDRHGGNLVGAAAWVSPSVCERAPAGARTFFRVVFRDNDGQTFRMQGLQVAAAVRKARALTGEARVTIVAHSMGGLAARAYLQAPEYGDDVEALLTVATPHLGSLLPFLVEEDVGRCAALARWLAGKDLAALGVSLLRPDSDEMLSLNLGQTPYTAIPGGVRHASIVGSYDAGGSSSCVLGHKAWLASWQQRLQPHFDPSRAHALVSPGVFANWSDGIVPVTSQYLRAVPVGYALDVEVETVKGFHSDLPADREVWKIIESFLAGGTATPPAGCDVVDLAMLVDSSGSMKENDPKNLRKQAASLLVDRAPPGTVFSVVDFDSRASVLLSRRPDPEAARRAVQGVDAEGGTDIKRALVAGFETLASGSGSRAAILFTDGRSTQRGGTEGFIREGIPVHVVGLGSGVDASYLQRLAASTNGLYMHAAGASDLAEVFDRVISELACEGTVLGRTGRIGPGEQQEHRFIVDALLNRLVVRVTWPGSRVDVELFGPDGRPAGAVVASGPTYQIVAVDRPRQGAWTARVIGAEVGPAGEPYTLRAGGPSDLRLVATQPDKKDPTTLSVSTVGAVPGLSVARTWSKVTHPGGKVVEGPRLTPAGAGAWSLAVPVSSGGIYTVTVGLSGAAPRAGEWAREVTRTLVVGQGMIPWRGTVTRVEGGYMTINRGARHGVREGMRVTLKPGRDPAGVGMVISVLRSSSTVEVQELSGSYLPSKGMTVELDRKQWMADSRW